ncbi:uncharacterized protein LOC124153056 isoform X2 [Haliotis rufescens]|uniref:uncharacterized protein LOC124153056 isoform X2 n=1 Tax=Haliotis rufescens TaxID=6454 RepID=UPI00201F03EB|nr:uncharacterized protein LOC124153056 isoform X2 [Haliotis rufescens]
MMDRNKRSSGLYKCKECCKDFQTDLALFQHLTARNKRCGNSACFYCDYGESVPGGLSDHIKTRHSVFECAFCSKKFFLRTHFEVHMKHEEGIVNSWRDDPLPGMDDTESFSELIERLNPDAIVYEECQRIKEKLEWFMHHNTSYKKCHITMAGSIAKQTPLRKADVDLILFLHDFKTMTTFIESKKEIIERIKRHVENRDMNWAHGLRFQKRTQNSIQFELSVSGSSTSMDVDLLPAVQLLRRNSSSERDALYTNMKSMSAKERKHCGPCLSELQVEFVHNVPNTLKDVIRIIKYWIKIVRKDERCTTVRCYFCELVVIDYWMKNDSPDDPEIDIDDYVIQVLYRLCFCQSLRIIWPETYDFLKYRSEEAEPIVLDPANPFVNVAPNMKDALRVSQCAIELFERYGTVKPKHLSSRQLTYRSPAYICPSVTLQRPAAVAIDMWDSCPDDVSTGTGVMSSVNAQMHSSNPSSKRPAKSLLSSRQLAYRSPAYICPSVTLQRPAAVAIDMWDSCPDDVSTGTGVMSSVNAQMHSSNPSSKRPAKSLLSSRQLAYRSPAYIRPSVTLQRPAAVAIDMWDSCPDDVSTGTGVVSSVNAQMHSSNPNSKRPAKSLLSSRQLAYRSPAYICPSVTLQRPAAVAIDMWDSCPDDVSTGTGVMSSVNAQMHSSNPNSKRPAKSLLSSRQLAYRSPAYICPSVTLQRPAAVAIDIWDSCPDDVSTGTGVVSSVNAQMHSSNPSSKRPAKSLCVWRCKLLLGLLLVSLLVLVLGIILWSVRS